MKNPDDDNKSISSTQFSNVIKSDTKIVALENAVQLSSSSSLFQCPKTNPPPALLSDHNTLPSFDHDSALNSNNNTEKPARSSLTYSETNASLSNGGIQLTSFEVKFGDDDPRDPQKWPLWYRSLIVLSATVGSISVVMHCTSYTRSMPGMMEEFGLIDKKIPTYGITSFLIGIATGSFVLAPLSEIFGRRPVYFVSLLMYCLSILPCAMATSIHVIIASRFFR